MAEDKDAKKRAQANLEDIATLKKTPAFSRYFVRRVEEELEKRRKTVLEDWSLTPEQLYRERLLYLAASDTAKMMEEDETAFKNILGTGSEED